MSAQTPSSDSKSGHPSIRARLYRHLEPSARKGTGLSVVNQIVGILIIAASAVAIFETEASLHGWIPDILLALELCFTLLFSIEYLARLYAAGEDPRYRGISGRIRYALTWWAIVDLLAILPFILTMGSQNTMLIRLFKLVRILRLAKLGRFSDAWNVLSDALKERRFELGLTSAIAVLLMLVSSSLLFLIEGENQPDTFGSIPRALWWSVVTLTTVGYGDAAPLSALGKCFAAMTALAGVGLIAMPAGILAAAFSNAFQKRKPKHER